MSSRRVSLPSLSLLLAALLLGACSKEAPQEEASAQEQQEQQEQQDQSASAQEAETPEPPPMQLWPYVGPLVAGSYPGKCTLVPEATASQSAIAVAADGKASAPGFAGDFSKSTKMMLMRQPGKEGGSQTSANLSIGETASLNLMDRVEAQLSIVTLSDGNRGVSCNHAGPVGKLGAQPLYTTFAKVMEVKGQTLACIDLTDAANFLTPKDMEVSVADGVLTVAGQKTEFAKALNELVLFSDNSFSYSFYQSEPPGTQLIYDGMGKLKHVSRLPVGGKEYQCGAKG